MLMSDVKQKIQDFLSKNGYEFGVYYEDKDYEEGLYEDDRGIEYKCAQVRPKYSPIDGAYTITVDAESVKGWGCDARKSPIIWNRLWCESYNSPGELLEILNRNILPPVGCWKEAE